VAYAYSQKITIDHTKVPNTDQTNYPLTFYGTYAALATVANGGNVVNTATVNGLVVPTDLIFTSDSALTTILSYEVAFYDATTGKIEAHILIATLSHTADTLIYLGAGNAAVTTFQGGSVGSAWNSGFKFVAHLSDGTTLSGKDSTSNANNLSGQDGSPSAVAGKLDGGMATSSSDLRAPDAASLQPTNITVELWVNSSSPGSYILSKLYAVGGIASYAMYTSFSSTSIYFYVSDGSSLTKSPNGGNVWDGNWHYVVGTWDGTTATIYADATSGGGTAGARTAAYTASNLYLGSFDGTSSSLYYNGSMDEVRISNVVRSADWITTTYNNQSSPSTFYTLSSNGGTNITVSVTGSSMTGSIGTVTETGTANVSPSGSSLTFSIGTPTKTGTANVTSSGNSLTFSIGTTTNTGTANVTPIGNSLTFSIGTPTKTGTANVSPTGSVITGSVGTTTETGSANVSPSGSALTLSVGNVTASSNVSISVSGNSVTASIGTLSITGNSSVSPSGVVITSSAGTVVVSGNATAVLSGNLITGAIGTVTITGSATISVNGNVITCSAGTVTVSTGGNITVNVTGSSMSFSIGTPSISGSANVSTTGSSLALQAGNITISGNANVSVSGNLLTSASGTVLIVGNANVSVNGNLITSGVHSVSIGGNAIVLTTGNVITAAVGNVNIIVPGTLVYIIRVINKSN
jgi:hypothetical protein